MLEVSLFTVSSQSLGSKFASTSLARAVSSLRVAAVSHPGDQVTVPAESVPTSQSRSRESGHGRSLPVGTEEYDYRS